MTLLTACVAASLLLWDPLPDPDLSHYEVRLNHVLLGTTTGTAFNIGPGCGIAEVRGVDRSGNAGAWSGLLEYGPCAVGCRASFAVKSEQQGCCPVASVPWRP